MERRVHAIDNGSWLMEKTTMQQLHPLVVPPTPVSCRGWFAAGAGETESTSTQTHTPRMCTCRTLECQHQVRFVLVCFAVGPVSFIYILMDALIEGGGVV